MKHRDEYMTYRQIMSELLKPIVSSDLDVETIRRLYESKLVYLDSIRVKAFKDINSPGPTNFRTDDYELIIQAIDKTKKNIKELVHIQVRDSISSVRRKAG